VKPQPNKPPGYTLAYLTQRVFRFVGVRNRSRQEVVNYLNRLRPPVQPDLIDQVLVQIEHFNILNDEQFAQEYATSLAAHGKGPRYIAYQLQSKGIDAAIIERVIGGGSDSAVVDSAWHQVQKKLASWSNLSGFALKAKVYRYLYTRGYTSTQIDRVIDEHLPHTVK
jgi:SOS response regulatory protein OraA/RecX